MTLPRQRPRHVEPPDGSARPSERSLDLLLDRLAGSDGDVREPALRELVALADARPALRGPVAEAVCRYLRSPWQVETPGVGGPTGEPHLRRTALSMLTDRLHDPDDPAGWCGCDLDLAGAVLVGADFAGCWFTDGRVRLEGAWAVEGRIAFDGARFCGARVGLRHWTSGQGELSFRGARFSAGVVSLAGSTLCHGSLDAQDAVVDGGTLTLTEIRLDGAVLDLRRVAVSAGLLSLSDARLRSGSLLLVDARLTGGLTTLRNLRTAAGVLRTDGALMRPGAVDLDGSRELVVAERRAAAAAPVG